jgi:glutamate-1-semialdehyde 2,1-aminomutase
VMNYADAKRADRAAYGAFFHAMLDAGVYLPPSAFESAFTSAAHGEAELDAFEAAVTTAWAR